MKNVPPYLVFFLYNNKRRVCLFNVLKKQPIRAAGKKISSKVYEHIGILVYEFTANKVTKNDLFQCGFLKTLLT